MSPKYRSSRSVSGLRSLLTAGLLIAAPAGLHAQRPDSASMQQQFSQMSNMMGPMMSNMAQAQLIAAVTTLARPEIAQQLATFTKNYYDALINQGFSKEDALRIVAGGGALALVSRH